MPGWSDVGEKAVTHRTAVAVGRVTMSPECFAAVAESRAKKGDVLGVAQVAGIMATKRTSDLIPLCHTLLLTKSAVEFTLTRRSTASRRVHRPVRGPDRRGDGGPDRRFGGPADGLRYVQGH